MIVKYTGIFETGRENNRRPPGTAASKFIFSRQRRNAILPYRRDSPFSRNGFVGIHHRHHFPDEFMAEHAGERIVAAQQLQIGAADAGEADADERFAGGMRFGEVTQGEGLVFEPEGLHGKRFYQNSQMKAFREKSNCLSFPSGIDFSYLANQTFFSVTTTNLSESWLA